MTEWSVIAPITLIPALGVSLWLSKLIGVPYGRWRAACWWASSSRASWVRCW